METEQSLKQKPYKSSNAEVRKPTGLWDVGAAVEETKKILLLVLGNPFITCCLFGLFINQPVSPCQTDQIVIYVPVLFFEARLASLPFNLSCHVILFSKVCHTLLVGPKCLRCCSSEIFELAVSGSYYSLHFHMKAAECHLLFSLIVLFISGDPKRCSLRLWA